jgi:predicted MFS family arabinose efflux permease
MRKLKARSLGLWGGSGGSERFILLLVLGLQALSLGICGGSGGSELFIFLVLVLVLLVLLVLVPVFPTFPSKPALPSVLVFLCIHFRLALSFVLVCYSFVVAQNGVAQNGDWAVGVVVVFRADTVGAAWRAA